MTKKESATKGIGCLVLFALPFAGVGVFMAYLIGAALLDASSMRSWEEVPAELVSVNLWESRSSDSNSVRAQATYHYQYSGRPFTGTRVSLHKGSDSVGSYQRDVYYELSSRRGSTFRCFVNPENPAEAVLFRDLRWELLGFYSIFLVVFGGAGFGLIGAGIYGGKKANRDAELEARHPDEPWMHKDNWASGKIVSTTKPVLIMSAVFAILWNAISSPLLFMVPEILENENKLALLAFVFPAVGGMLIVWAFRNLLRFRKFRRVRVRDAHASRSHRRPARGNDPNDRERASRGRLRAHLELGADLPNRERQESKHAGDRVVAEVARRRARASRSRFETLRYPGVFRHTLRRDGFG